MKRACPFCGEEINADAQKCKHCGEWIKGDPEKKKEGIIVAGCLIVFFGIICFCCLGGWKFFL